MNNPFETILNKLDAIESTVNSFVSINSKNSREIDLEKEDEYFDIGGASIFLKMPVSTVHFHKKHHDLPFLKPGKRLVFKKTDLLVWIEKYNSTDATNALSPMLQNRKRYAK